MNTHSNLRARYSRGTLKLRNPLQLPDGTEVRVSLTVLDNKAKRRRIPARRYSHANRAIAPQQLMGLTGVVSLGGDALADSEDLYNGSQ